MTVEQAAELRRATEKAILQLVEKFESESGCSVRNITYLLTTEETNSGHILATHKEVQILALI